MQSTQPTAGYAYSDAFLGHDLPEHPENAARLRSVLAALDRLGILARLQALPVVPADEEDVALVHSPRYLSCLRQASAGPAYMIDQDSYLCAGSYDAAISAVGASIACVRAVCLGPVRRAVALLRPPGHHARPGAVVGFCLLNNVACAAAYALRRLKLDRVLIFDFDVHHGNGTQEIFYEDPGVLYVSLHQSPLFPMTGGESERGEGAGRGYNINVPLRAAAGDATYAACMEQILVPAARAYRPQLVLVSAGYDAHWRDPLAHMAVTVSGFDDMARCLMLLADELCDGRIAFFLEGGYDHAILAACIANLCAAAAELTLPLQDPAGAPPTPPIDDIDRVRRQAASLGFGH